MKLVLALILMGFVSACNKSSGSGAPTTPGDAIPADIQMEAQSAQPLSEQDLTEIRSFLRSNDAKLPSNSVIYREDSSASQSERTERSQKLQALDSDGQEALRSAKANCIINEKTKSEKGSLQKAGDTSVTVTSQSITGASCPLEDSARSEIKNTLVEYSVDQSAGKINKISGFITGNSSNQSVSKDARWISWGNGKKSIKMNIDINAAFEATSDKTRMFVQFSGQGEVQTANGLVIRMALSSRALMSGGGGYSGYTNTKSDNVIKIFFPNMTLVIQEFTQLSNGQLSKKILINGRPSTENDLKDLTGGGFSMGNMKTQAQVLR